MKFSTIAWIAMVAAFAIIIAKAAQSGAFIPVK